MPLHDYRCDRCFTLHLDVYRSISEGARSRPPVCCGRPTQWLPAVGRMDIQGGQGSNSGFHAFDCYVKGPDGVDRLTHIDSLHSLRKVERETESHWRNGEGTPMRFRAYNQDSSNQLVNTFGADPGQILRAELATAQQDIRGRKDHLRTLRGEEAKKASETLGPGVTEDSASSMIVPFGPE